MNIVWMCLQKLFSLSIDRAIISGLIDRFFGP